MGLFDKLRSTTDLQFDDQQAVMAIVLGAIAADGDIADDELHRMRLMCSLSPLFARNTREQDDRVIDYCVQAFRQTNWDTEQVVAKAAEALAPSLRETAFAFACDMLLADGTVTSSEESFLIDLAGRLSVPDATVQAVVDTTIIRNRMT